MKYLPWSKARAFFCLVFPDDDQVKTAKCSVLFRAIGKRRVFLGVRALW